MVRNFPTQVISRRLSGACSDRTERKQQPPVAVLRCGQATPRRPVTWDHLAVIPETKQWGYGSRGAYEELIGIVNAPACSEPTSRPRLPRSQSRKAKDFACVQGPGHGFRGQLLYQSALPGRFRAVSVARKFNADEANSISAS